VLARVYTLHISLRIFATCFTSQFIAILVTCLENTDSIEGEKQMVQC